VDRALHARYLHYRELFAYFGQKAATIMSAAQFAEADAQHAELEAKGERRNEVEEARMKELTKLLFRD